MFDQKDMESYQRIKVPSELKNRILADCEAEQANGKRNIGGAFPSQRWIRSLSAVAACFALAIAVFSMTRMNTAPVTLLYEGAEPTHRGVEVASTATLVAADPRTVTPMGIPLEFKVRETAEITVSAGSLYSDSETDMGQSVTVTKDTVLWWAILPGSEHQELTVNADGERTVYVLELNDLAPNGVIYKK